MLSIYIILPPKELTIFEREALQAGIPQLSILSTKQKRIA